MKTILFLSFILIFANIGCQRKKMDAKDLTTMRVKREQKLVPQDTETHKLTITSQTPPLLPKEPEQQNVTQQKIEQPNTPPKKKTKSYHIIVASHPREDLAKDDVEQLKNNGFPEAQIIIKDQRYRVSIAHYTDKQEAARQRDLIANQLGKNDLWVMLY